MELTELQKDALTELINIAFSRTAASLSELTGNRVELEVPEVAIHPIPNLAVSLSRFVTGEVATVHQVFSGPVAGDALLLLNIDGAANLVALLTGDAALPNKRMGASAKEVLSEVGNILLNACLGVFGNLLEVRFSFTVPQLHLDALEDMLSTFVVGKEELRHALIVGAKFQVRSSEVTGCLVLVLTVASLDLLIQAIEHWADVSVVSPPEIEPER